MKHGWYVGGGETGGRDGGGGVASGGEEDSKPRYRVFTMKLSGLPTFEGIKDAEKMITFIAVLERAFSLLVLAIGTTGSTRSSVDYAIQLLVGKATKW